jgi:hypothetical protein
MVLRLYRHCRVQEIVEEIILYRRKARNIENNAFLLSLDISKNPMSADRLCVV